MRRLAMVGFCAALFVLGSLQTASAQVRVQFRSPNIPPVRTISGQPIVPRRTLNWQTTQSTEPAFNRMQTIRKSSETDPLSDSPDTQSPSIHSGFSLNNQFSEDKDFSVIENGGAPEPRRSRSYTSPDPQEKNGFTEALQGDSELEDFEALPPELSDLPDDSTDEGHEEILQYYPDGKLKIRRYVKQDSDGNYVKDGPWLFYDREKRAIAAGRYQNGIMHGQWRRIHASSEGGLFSSKPFNLYQGQFESIANFKQGKLDGVWTINDQYRRKIFEIAYKDGVRHGLATWWYPNGARMRVANFEDGLLDGAIKEWDESEKPTSATVYVKGRKFVRNTTYYRPTVPKTEDQYLDAKLEPDGEDNWWEAQPTRYVASGDRVKDGDSLEWYENGQRKKRGSFKNGLPVATFTWWHPNGNKQIEGSYKQGVKTGRWTWWHGNGMKSFEGMYQDNNPVGIWRSWYADGRVQKEETFSLDDVQKADSEESVIEPAVEDPNLESLPEPLDQSEFVPSSTQPESTNLAPSSTNVNFDPPPADELEQITPIEFNDVPIDNLGPTNPATDSSSGRPIGALPAGLFGN